MTVFGSKDHASTRGASDEEARDGEERHFEFRDRRRIDPDTGAARDVPQPGSASADPGNPANAGQPITATTADTAELEQARTEAAERTADLQRLSAEYANYRKRVERDKQVATSAGKAAVVAELLAVLDDLERAAEHGDLTGGFKTVADKFTGTLQRLGLEHYGAEGEAFDPNLHEAVQFATSPDVSEPTVTTVLRLGYLFGERVLRPAVVMVTGPEDEATEPAPEDAAPEDAVPEGFAEESDGSADADGDTESGDTESGDTESGDTERGPDTESGGDTESGARPAGDATDTSAQSSGG